MENRKTLKTTSQWIRTMQRGFVWTIWKNEKNENLGTDYFVQCWIPYEWNESMEWIQEAGQTKKHVGQSATSRRKRHGQPRETERQMMCDRGPLIDRLIDTWHLKAKSMASHARQITGYHRKTQKNTEIYDFRIFRANSSFFLHISAFLRSEKI